MPFVDKQNAHSKDYRKTIKAISLTNKCPFCRENFRYHKHPILKQINGWFITKSSWPYKNTRFHFLILNHLHRTDLNDLNINDYLAISRLTSWTVKKFKIRGGGFAFRFGDTKLTGATVSHIHAHLIVPKINPKTRRAFVVNFPIG
jgi:diadenosine tetraphosphate (Ap4A) HIT family hydrolase